MLFYKIRIHSPPKPFPLKLWALKPPSIHAYKPSGQPSFFLNKPNQPIILINPFLAWTISCARPFKLFYKKHSEANFVRELALQRLSLPASSPSSLSAFTSSHILNFSSYIISPFTWFFNSINQLTSQLFFAFVLSTFQLVAGEPDCNFLIRVHLRSSVSKLLLIFFVYRRTMHPCLPRRSC